MCLFTYSNDTVVKELKLSWKVAILDLPDLPEIGNTPVK